MTLTFTETETTPEPRGHDPLAQLRAYWEGLRQNGTLPVRSQISPRGIEQALSYTFLMERIAPGMARFRIAGMDLADFMGMEVRGLPFSSIFCPIARAELTARLEAVFRAPAILSMDLIAERGIGRPHFQAKLLALPLRDDQDRVTMALGCFSLRGKVGRSPRRFEIAGASLERLADVKAPCAPRLVPVLQAPISCVPASASPESHHAFAEAAEQFKRPDTVPYLRVIK
jgi:hypothetical protein